MLAALARLTSCCRWSGCWSPRRSPPRTCSRRSGSGSPAPQLFDEHRGDADPRRRRLRAVDAEHRCIYAVVSAVGAALLGGGRRVRVRQVPLPRRQRRLQPRARRRHGADHRSRDPDLPALRASRAGQHPVGGHPAVAGEPVRALPHARLRRRTPSRTPSSRPPARRRRRGPDLLRDRVAAAGAGPGDRRAVHARDDLEQLLPATDHAQRPQASTRSRSGSPSWAAQAADGGGGRQQRHARRWS